MGIFRNHLITFILGLPCIFGFSKVIPSIGFFWGMMFWGCCVLSHKLYKISAFVSDEWATKRADELVDSSYDLHHIENIRERRTSASKVGLKNGQD